MTDRHPTERQATERQATPSQAAPTSGRFDYLIVGAGFAGSVLAERLASAG